VFDARQSNLRDVTSYAPIRIVLMGLVRGVFGLLVMGMGALAIFATAAGETKPTQPGDMPSLWMGLVGAALAIFGLVLASGGAGRIVSAFAGGCYLKAGPEGLAVRMPLQTWYGPFKLVEYHHKWEEIEQLYDLTRKVNLIPVARELHIRVYGGTEITIQRFYFSASVKRILDELLRVRAQAGK
jgi:hypothetical protein